MSPIRDVNNCIRATSDGATAGASTNSAVFEFDGTPIRGLALVCHLTTASGTSPTVTAIVHMSTSTTAPTTDSRIVANSGVMTPPASGTYAEYITPFSAPDARALLVEFVVGGTSPIFDGLEAYLTFNVGKNWDRSISFR